MKKVNGSVGKGTAVYCNGIALQILAVNLITVSRNGFRQTRLTKVGDMVRHAGVTVRLHKDGLSIKSGGRPVELFHPLRSYFERQRITGGELETVQPTTKKINSKLLFHTMRDYLHARNDVFPVSFVGDKYGYPIGVKAYHVEK